VQPLLPPPPHSQAPPYPIPNPIPRFPHPLLCCHAHDAGASTAVIPPPWFSALRPSRTSSSLYIAALGPPEAIPPFPCASPSPERCFQYHPAAALRPHAGDPLPDLPKSGQAFKRVRRGSLSLPTPFPLSSEPFPRRIGAKTELALAGHGRRTCSRRFNSFQGSICKMLILSPFQCAEI
jgi:hypothetical protein